MERRRKPLRLKEYDYRSAGAYFVTICVANREMLLGRIVGDAFVISDVGAVVDGTMGGLSDRFPGCMIDSYVIMPNHIHAIVFLGTVPDIDVPVAEKGRSRPTPTANHGDTNVRDDRVLVGAGLDLPYPGNGRFDSNPKLPALSDVVRAFKTISALGANKILGRTGTPFWQRNFYEHIIRNDASLDRIREYIASNPANWAQDKENPDRR